jgi:hypothetical protein
MKISKQKLKQIIMEEMQKGPVDSEVVKIEIGKLNTDFAKWADELQTLYGKEEIPMEPNPYDVGEDGELLWKTHSPQEFKEKFHADKDVQEEKENNPWAICTASVGPENEDKFEECVLSVKQQKENKTMKISKAELMEIIKEEIMGAISEEEAVEEVAEEQPLEEMDVASMLSPENIEALRIAYEALQKLVTNGVIPTAALGAGVGAAYNKVMGPHVPQDSGDE